MAKRKITLNTERKINEGMGLGNKEEYKPWIKIQDFPSTGRVSRIKGIKTNRQHEFLSDLERNYFYFLEFSEDVIDIREQYPLFPLQETLLIAKELGIQHPKDPKTQEPIVMTTDFLITIKDTKGEVRDIARTLKYKKELLKERVLEKFEIERIYFERHCIDWGIVTEKEVSSVVAHNLSDLHAYCFLDDIEGVRFIEKTVREDMLAAFISRLIDYEGTLRSVCNSFDKDMQLLAGTSIALLKHLLFNKVLTLDLSAELNLNQHLSFKLNRVGLRERMDIG